MGDQLKDDVQLKDDAEELFRHVHPNHCDEGNPTSQAFVPTSKDGGKLSVDRSEMTTAEKSLRLFRRNGGAADSVYALTVGEFRELEIPCVGNPTQGNGGRLPNPAHAYADFRKHRRNVRRTKAKRLKEMAIARGRIYP